ncbi:hypothetical protein HIM_05955 [Hirsutella minnesotensis 3608]|uniref:G-patch domain-containing protein n=1 Tax=Hirsutella minnesotensis 3608 TaxID=1043627 RepID=A0A0F7ZNZ4_9HYPO|nr:hypothetical protein HIM_05955 [Hirsutella minnesotensis 3608]
MSQKRSRTTFETDSSAPYAIFGTPLPDEAEARDDGSFVPLWKQEVRDDRGRKRLHGAFTGGWSAGYFNTVGSKEGWTPSTFVSSRTNRHKGTPASGAAQQRVEDYMDEEDLADAAEAQKLQTSQAFAGIGSSETERDIRGLAGLLRADGNTMGLQLMRRMGWKDGQGIGPKVRRSARLDLSQDSSASNGEKHLFAPDNASMIRFIRKTDRKGLGHHGEAKLKALTPENDANRDDDDDEQERGIDQMNNGKAFGREKSKTSRGAFGVGVLNDTGSDDEDPYEMGPKIRYNRTIGGQKKKKSKKGALAVANPTLAKAPKFIPKTARAGHGLGRCHDGKMPLEGFVLASLGKDFTDLLLQYAPPTVPPGWKSAKSLTATSEKPQYTSTSDAARASSLDARSRAALLGEKSLPGKSVFDYLTPSARDKMAVASGQKDLPPAKGEVPTQNTVSDEERYASLMGQVPNLDGDSAAAALSRVSAGPYADDERKRARYRRYLEHQLNAGQPRPEKAPGMTDEDFVRELNEFYNCARIFKPMTGFMASRFTTSKTAPSTSSSGEASAGEPLSKPVPKETDPAEDAARMGMFGRMTRSVEDFYPSRLLCKRFNVKAPSHVVHDPEAEESHAREASESRPASTTGQRLLLDRPSTGAKLDIQSQRKEAQGAGKRAVQEPEQEPVSIDPERNETLEGGTASAGVLRAIFADGKSHREDEAVGHADLEPPQYPASEASSASRPPPFSSLFAPFPDAGESSGKAVAPDACSSASLLTPSPAYSDGPRIESEPFEAGQAAARAFYDPVAETKNALPRDTKGESSRKDDDAEPPPAYTEGDSPLQSFTYVMSAAGGASSIITQVQQGGPPINALGDVGADETIAMDLRGTRFVLSRDELLTLPEFVLLSLFPNGLFPEGHMNGFSDNDAVQVDYDPASLQYMLDFFRNVAQSIPSESSPSTSQDGDAIPVDSLGSRDDSSKRAGIIVLREDLDFYAIPPRADISPPDMIEVKRAAARALQYQDGIFSGLKRSDEPGTTEAHLIEMLTAGGFNHDDRWGHRAGEPNKAVICSLALARLRSDIRGNDMGTSAVGMAQKLLLFWRKPARRCWWEGIELDNIEGVEGKLKVWIRRVWTLEMSVIGLR